MFFLRSMDYVLCLCGYYYLIFRGPSPGTTTVSGYAGIQEATIIINQTIKILTYDLLTVYDISLLSSSICRMVLLHLQEIKISPECV